MDFLASLEPDQLLQLLLGIIGCAIVLAVLLFGYLLFVWRRTRKSSSAPIAGDSTFGDAFESAAVGLDDRLTAIDGEGAAGTADSAATDDTAGDERDVDVNARLSGIGRDAWQLGLVESANEYPSLRGEEVLRLVVSGDGGCWVEIAGDTYRKWTDIRDRAVGDNALRAISWCLRFTQGLVMTGQGVRSVKVPVGESVPVPVALGGVSGAFSRDEIFRLLSDSLTDGFWVQVGDQCYSALVQVRRKEIGERILTGTSRLLQFSQGRVAAGSGLEWVAVPDLPDQAVSVTSPLPTLQVSPEVAQEKEKRLAQERFIRDMLEEKERLAQPAAERSPASEQARFDLVADIDRIFQAKLAASSMANIDAEILAGPEGGVRIRVGTKHYDTPDEVPDSELRQMMKAAIAEW